MKLTIQQIRAIHAKKWNNLSEADRQKIMTRHGFGQSAGIRGTMTPLVKRNYKELPDELQNQLILGKGDF